MILSVIVKGAAKNNSGYKKELENTVNHIYLTLLNGNKKNCLTLG